MIYVAVHEAKVFVGSTPGNMSMTTTFLKSNQQRQSIPLPTPWQRPPVQLDAFRLARFKNGGKRHAAMTGKIYHDYDPTGTQILQSVRRDRPVDRRQHAVIPGDVEEYRKLPYGKPMQAPGIDRDHQYSGAAIKRMKNANFGRTLPDGTKRAYGNRPVMNPAWSEGSLTESMAYRRGFAIAILHSNHMKGLSWGPKNNQPVNQVFADPQGRFQTLAVDTRGTAYKQWSSVNPTEAAYADAWVTIAAHVNASQLTCEVVGGYRRLYKLSVEKGLIQPTDLHDRLIEDALRIAQ